MYEHVQVSFLFSMQDEDHGDDYEADAIGSSTWLDDIEFNIQSFRPIKGDRTVDDF